MLNRLLLAGFFLLLWANLSICFAQTNYEKGYYITYKDDTVHGFIEYIGDESNARYCSFRKDPKDNTIRLTSLEIKGYVINDQMYFEAFKFDYGAYQVRRFLMYLVRGDVSLLMYPNGSKPFYFSYDHRNNELVNLENGTDIIWGDGKKFGKKDGYGREALESVMADHWSDVSRRISSGDNLYEEKTLKRVFADYNTLAGTDAVTYSRIKATPHVGIDLTGKYGFRKATFDLTPEVNFSSDFMDMYGGGLTIFISVPRKNENLKFYISGVYTEYSVYGHIAEGNIYQDLRADYASIEGALGVLRTNITDLNFTIGINYLYNHILEEEYAWREERFFPVQNAVYTSDITDFGPLIDGGMHGAALSVGKDWMIGRTRYINTSIEYSYLREFGRNTHFHSFNGVLRFSLLP